MTDHDGDRTGPGRAAPRDPLRPSLVERDSAQVLVVEDDSFVLEIMKRVLAEAGYDVAAAGDHDSALEAAGERPLAALVTDLVLPGRNGYELATALRARQPGLPVLVVTGHAADDGPHPGTRLLRKPFAPSQLLAELRTLLHASAE